MVKFVNKEIYSRKELLVVKSLLSSMRFYIDDFAHPRKQIWFDMLGKSGFTLAINFDECHHIQKGDFGWEEAYKFEPKQIEDILEWMQTHQSIKLR